MTFNRRRPRQIIVPDDDPRLKTSWFQPTLETLREQEELLSKMFFLVRQGDEFGERLRCKRCNNRHDYITLMCVEKPISGLANGLYAYWRAMREAKVEKDLAPQHLTRLREVEAVLQGMPDISKVHPQLARKLTQDIGPSDLRIGAISLGILQGISRIEAESLVDRINIKGLRPPYSLTPVNQAEVERALAYRGPQRQRGRW